MAGGLAAAWHAGAGRLARRADVPRTTALAMGSPLLWGCALPAAAIAVDPFAFWCVAPPLAALGVGVGGLVAGLRWSRLRPSGVRARTDAGGSRLGAALLAVALPLALIPDWPAPSGDEPHYLLVAHSLLTDRDLDVSDDYAAREYAPFHPPALSPHSRPGWRPGSRYAMHGIGLGLLVMPAYAVGRAAGPWAMVFLPRATLALLYGLFAWLLYGLIRDLAGERAARRGVLASTLLAPLIFSPTSLFPEVPAMTLALVAYRGLQAGGGSRLAFGAAAVAALPFFGVKYLPLAAALAIVGAVGPGGARRHGSQASRRSTARGKTPRGIPGGAGRWRPGAELAGLAGLTVGVAGHAVYTWSLYRSFSPAAVYLGAAGSPGAPALGGDWGAYLAQWPRAAATLLGYLMDQKDGLLAYGPHFLLVAAGLPWLWRRRRREVVGLSFVFFAYVVPYALSQQLSGQGPPVRPLMAVLWALAPALGAALALDAGNRRWFAGVRGALLALSGCLTVAYAGWPELLPHDYPVTASRLVRAHSPAGSGWWAWFPQWVNVEEPAWGVAVAWTLAIAAFVTLLARAGLVADNAGAVSAGAEECAGLPEKAAGIAAPAAETPVGQEAAGGAMVAMSGWIAAAAVVVALTGVVLVERAALAITDLDRPVALEAGPVVWLAQELPERAWAEAGGIWVSPGRAVDFVLVVEQQLATLDVALRVLVEAEVDAWVGADGLRGRASPGALALARLRPGAGYPVAGGTAYAGRLFAAAGASPAALNGGADERVLGVFLQITGSTGSPPVP